MFLIDQKIFRGAKKGIRNFSLNLCLFQSPQGGNLNAQIVFENKAKYLNQDFMFINSSLFIENEFLKLFKIGILRREFDGQGHTSKVRITPMGRQVLENNSDFFTKEYHY